MNEKQTLIKTFFPDEGRQALRKIWTLSKKNWRAALAMKHESATA